MRVVRDTRSGWDAIAKVMRYEHAYVFDDNGSPVCTIKHHGRGLVLIAMTWPFLMNEFRGGTDQSRWTYYPTFEAAYEALVTKLVTERLEAA